MKIKKALLGIGLCAATMFMFSSCILIYIFCYSDLTFKNDLVSENIFGGTKITIVSNLELRDADTKSVIQHNYTNEIRTYDTCTFEDVENDKPIYFTFNLYYNGFYYNIATSAFTIDDDTVYSLYYDCIDSGAFVNYSTGSVPRVAIKAGDQIIDCTVTPAEKQ